MDRTAGRVLVTGATGLLGSNLVRGLIAQGSAVKALVRSAEKARVQFKDLTWEATNQMVWLEVDVRRPDSYRHHLRHVETVFHTAAYFRDGFGGAKHAKHIFETNVVRT